MSYILFYLFVQGLTNLGNHFGQRIIITIVFLCFGERVTLVRMILICFQTFVCNKTFLLILIFNSASIFMLIFVIKESKDRILKLVPSMRKIPSKHIDHVIT